MGSDQRYGCSKVLIHPKKMGTKEYMFYRVGNTEDVQLKSLELKEKHGRSFGLDQEVAGTANWK